LTPFAGVALLPVAAPLLAGCALAASVAQGPPEDLSTWSLTPLAPDPALAASAIGEDGACRMDDPTDNVVAPQPQILVQDRRTQNTAAFLVLSPQHFGDCTVSRGTGSSGGYGPLLGAMNGQLTIENTSSGTVGEGSASTLGGRIAVPGAQVVVELRDGRRVPASVANGYWLMWWPSTTAAARVVALRPDGTEAASLDVVNP
jgi:hypothetical protein